MVRYLELNIKVLEELQTLDRHNEFLQKHSIESIKTRITKALADDQKFNAQFKKDLPKQASN